MIHRSYHSFMAFAAAAMLVASRAHAVDNVAGDLIFLNDNGAWSWFQDERAIVGGDFLLASSIADASGIGGGSRDGNVDVAAFNLNTRRTTRVTLSDIQADDHNSAALMMRPDGKFLALYGNHGSDNFTRWRVSSAANQPTSWQPEQTFNNGVGATYSNTFYLSAENKTYNFTRTNGYDPNFLISNDQGSTWSYGGHLLKDPDGSPNGRPYLKYASNGVDRVYFITTEQHPRNYNNGIYAGYMQAGQLYRMDGSLVGPAGTSVATAPSATAFTTVLAQNSVIDGTTRTHAWTTDLALDGGGNPYAIFTSRVAGSTSDHRFYYARWNGSQWNVHELARAGGFLYAAEDDYTGLVALDPDDPNSLHISTRINPITNATTPRYEIYKGVTNDNGASWNWTPVTQNSTVDNIRPIMPKWDGNNKALLWLRGTYTTYVDYDLSVVGLITTPGSQAVGPLTYVDASAANTVQARGLGVWSSAPNPNPGATDNLWHVRTGFGNNGSVLTADEVGAEDAPILTTSITGLDQGTYDVYALFWSDDDEQWQVQAGLTSQLSIFEKQAAQHVEIGEINGVDVVDHNNADLLLYRIYLGRAEVGQAGSIQVFIDDGFGSAGSRTWYDGVAYAMVPEPSSALFLGAAGWLLTCRAFRTRY